MNFLDYYFLIGFLGSIFAGETVIIPLAIISVQTDISVLISFLSCYAGVFLADYLWFLVGKKNLIGRFLFIPRSFRGKRLPRKLEKALLEKTFYSMILIKFTYGFRILAVLYLGNKFRKTKKFILYNSVALFLGVGSVFILGVLVGKGIGNFIEFFENIRLGITVVLISTIILVCLIKIFEKWFTKKEIKKK